MTSFPRADAGSGPFSYQPDSSQSSEKKHQMQIELLSHHTPLDMGGQDQVSEHKEFSFLEINRVPSPVNG